MPCPASPIRIRLGRLRPPIHPIVSRDCRSSGLHRFGGKEPVATVPIGTQGVEGRCGGAPSNRCDRYRSDVRRCQPSSSRIDGQDTPRSTLAAASIGSRYHRSHHGMVLDASFGMVMPSRRPSHTAMANDSCRASSGRSCCVVPSGDVVSVVVLSPASGMVVGMI